MTSSRRARWRIVPLVAAVALQSSLALADAASDADALFNEARKLSEKGDHAAACAKFEESKRLANGLGVTLYLADCMQKTAHSAHALELFREAQQMAHERKDKREKTALERADALEKTVPKLELKIAETSSELQVLVNDRQLTPAELGQPLRLDPGSYKVVAKAPGKADFQSEVQLAEGQTATLEIAALGDAPSTAAPTTTATPAPTAEAAAPADSGLTGRRTLAIALGAAGVVGVGVGTFFGLRAKSKLDESNESDCDANDKCDAAGLDLRSDAQSAALISTIGFGAGVVLLGAGAFFWFTAQPASPTALQVAPELSPVHAGLRVQRRF